MDARPRLGHKYDRRTPCRLFTTDKTTYVTGRTGSVVFLHRVPENGAKVSARYRDFGTVAAAKRYMASPFVFIA